ncbi:hypothetical protein [Campylobacter gracilis]|uniref:Uncharacterized protein n=1 Tax=Campylobacter gracilis RM3268 TaxID=553220 RepID=C8PH31_9BACT|nr:hypothetical protein [Campylobacter gracilis]AKT93417.1 hypothetical protein CGRAC_2009 [Campylobacter gracilis]EEV17852.1 hypothetical protein CAMGR0001_2219 [Campylobacter gracilis RM3268]UEB46478.1 hypothetical protein LK410_05170 [Campylobacter gracilis]
MNTNGRELGQIRANLIIASERRLGREINLTKEAGVSKILIKGAGTGKIYAAAVSATSRARCGVKFYFLPAARLNFISYPPKS